MKKDYLGDGCYIQEGYFKGSILLTCEDGISIYAQIHLEPDIVEKLYNYYKQLAEEK